VKTVRGTLVKICLLAFAAIYLSAWVITSVTAGPVVQNGNTTVSNAEAAALFDSKCSKCHGKDGRAKTLAGKLKHARNLADPDWQESVTDERIFNSISNGKGGMPAFGKKLSEAEINMLAAHVRTFKKSPDQK
jgi:mono/diheme cytochrome c family protein